MSLHRTWGLVKHDGRLLRRDPLGVVILTAVPLVMMAFLKPTFEKVLLFDGFEGATGAEHVVPGVATMFAYFLVPHLAFTVFREHGWNTWVRLRASGLSSGELLVGKLVVPFAQSLAQQAALFVVGGLLFDLHIAGSVAGVALVTVALSLTVVTLSLMLAAVLDSMTLVNALGNFLALVMSGFGGALTAVTDLPSWVTGMGRVFPTYWAMRGFRAVILEGDGLSTALSSVGMLLLFSAGFVALSVWRFRVEDVKVSWA